MVKAIARKPMVYIVLEGSKDNGSVDSAWANVDDANERVRLIQEQGFTAQVISRKVR